MKTQISILLIGCVLAGGVVGYISGYKTKERAADIELIEMTNLAFSVQNWSKIQSYLMLGERLASPNPENINEMRQILIGQFELSIDDAESDPEKTDMTTHTDLQKGTSKNLDIRIQSSLTS